MAIIIVGAITRVSMFMYITLIGISSGMKPLAAYSYGAKQYDKLKKVVNIMGVTEAWITYPITDAISAITSIIFI